jgi:hypothetical protein
MVVQGHGLAAAVLGTPAPMVDHFGGVGLADATGASALDMAVAASTVQPHGIEQKGNVMWRAGVEPLNGRR